MPTKLVEDGGADAAKVAFEAPGSALQRAASYAAACIVHHKRWPRYADEAHREAMRIIERDISAILVRITEDCCSCGGLPADDPSACAACQVYHRIFSKPNGLEERPGGDKPAASICK